MRWTSLDYYVTLARMKSPSYFIHTYGCQMNTNDSERISGVLRSIGFRKSETEQEADLVLFNTCSVREHAEQRIYGKMEDLMERKRKGEDVMIAITGCMAGRDKTGDLRRRLSMADLFFPTPEMVNLPRWIAELRPDWSISGDVEPDYLRVNPLRQKDHQAYVTIQTGCNHFCTYCVVPYARGLERNRPVSDILAEVRHLAESKVVDFTLLGQAVNDYRAIDPGNFSAQNPFKNHFAALLWEINQIDGVGRLHWTAAHPLSMDAEVIEAMGLDKQVNYLHLPVQSGSDEVLRRMNRKYTRAMYLDTVSRVKDKFPTMALGTDIIVGFCGETDKDFEDTVDLYRKCDFDISYTAQYSPRTGTLSYRLYQDDVPEEEKKERWMTLQDLMEETALRKNQTYLGRSTGLFVEKVEEGVAYGTNSELKAVKAQGADPDLVGRLVKVRVDKALTWLLEGEIVL